MNPPDDLREEYRGVEGILPDISAIVLGGEVVHRPSPNGDTPACDVASPDFTLVETENALRVGMVPCRNCWGPVCDYLAGEPDNPIERRGPEAADLTADVAADELVADGYGTVDVTQLKLTTRPEEVLVRSGGNKDVYHAPTDNGPLCGNSGEYRQVDRKVLAGHAEPCSLCFEVDEIDTSTP